MTKLIVALDTGDPRQAREWVQTLGKRVSFYKVGLELFVSAGPEIVAWLKEAGKQVFVDLKFHDIPNTASRAVASASRLGADLCTVHAGGGPAMLRACREQAGDTKLLAVTVLTSIDQQQLVATGVRRPLSEQVRAMADMAQAAGVHGVICAPTDLPLLADLPRTFLRVTPGIRLAGSAAGDQKRIATPGQAARGGATHIVVGRPITAAGDPVAAAETILSELEGKDNA